MYMTVNNSLNISVNSSKALKHNCYSMLPIVGLNISLINGLLIQYTEKCNQLPVMLTYFLSLHIHVK